MKYVLIATASFFITTTIACWSASEDFEGNAAYDPENSTNPTIPLSEGDPAGTSCPMTYSTQPCLCVTGVGEVPGRQVCLEDGSWNECECDVLYDENDPTGYDPSKNKIPADFTWQRTTPEGGTCKAGRYDGGFDGIYIPAITFGFGPIPVFGNVTFQLEKSSNGEFFTVTDGHMVGAALVAFLFEGDIVGTLDCSSRTFVGELKNCYYVIPGLPPFLFEGVIKAQYDKFNNAFVNGVWSVQEPNADGSFPEPLPVDPGVPVPLPPPLGGTGTWTNQWVQ